MRYRQRGEITSDLKPVCRDFSISARAGVVGPNASGSATAELEVVATSLSVECLAVTDGEAALPTARRVFDARHPRAAGAPGVEVVGGIARMPARHSPRCGPAPRQPA